MNDNEILKMVKVINSCTTKEQLLTATRYCKLWLDKYTFNQYDYHAGIKLMITYGFMLNLIIKKMITI